MELVIRSVPVEGGQEPACRRPGAHALESRVGLGQSGLEVSGEEGVPIQKGLEAVQIALEGGGVGEGVEGAQAVFEGVQMGSPDVGQGLKGTQFEGAQALVPVFDRGPVAVLQQQGAQGGTVFFLEDSIQRVGEEIGEDGKIEGGFVLPEELSHLAHVPLGAEELLGGGDGPERLVAQVQLHGVAGCQPAEPEGDQRHHQQGGNEPEQAFEQVAGHARFQVSS